MRLGFVSLPLAGHLNPMTALARKMQSRGHEIRFIGFPDSQTAIRAAHLQFVPFCEREFPLGSVSKRMSPVATLKGVDVLRHTLREVSPAMTEAALRNLPAAMAGGGGVDGLVLDVTLRYLELAAMRHEVPYVHIWNVLHLDTTGATPPFIYPWAYDPSPEGVARNRDGLRRFGELFGPALEVGKRYAATAGLKIDWDEPFGTLSKLGLISQTPREFDFPDTNWPKQFCYAGPFHDDEGREPQKFPWERLDGRPLIYASLGTLVNGLEFIYRAILDTAAALPDTQMVLSVGHNVNVHRLDPIPANVVAVRSAPQIELLKRAALCITHAGLNTTLESLACGVPMVAIPIGYDQPGVAMRIQYHGAGETLQVPEVNRHTVKQLTVRVLYGRKYHEQARYFENAIARIRGLDVAADALEAAFATVIDQDTVRVRA